MGEITKRSQHIEQACRVYGEEWRDILFKKWSFFEDVRPEDSHVYLVVKVSPSVNKNELYDTWQEAREALLKNQNERLKKVMERRGWVNVQSFSGWEWGLEDDLQSLATTVRKEDV